MLIPFGGHVQELSARESSDARTMFAVPLIEVDTDGLRQAELANTTHGRSFQSNSLDLARDLS